MTKDFITSYFVVNKHNPNDNDFQSQYVAFMHEALCSAAYYTTSRDLARDGRVRTRYKTTEFFRKVNNNSDTCRSSRTSSCLCSGCKHSRSCFQCRGRTKTPIMLIVASRLAHCCLDTDQSSARYCPAWCHSARSKNIGREIILFWKT